MNNSEKFIITICAATIIAIGAYQMGRTAGVNHAITDSEVYLPEGYVDTIADEGFTLADAASNSYWDNYVEDNTCQVQIVLDDNVYVHNAILSN